MPLHAGDGESGLIALSENAWEFHQAGFDSRLRGSAAELRFSAGHAAHQRQIKRQMSPVREWSSADPSPNAKPLITDLHPRLHTARDIEKAFEPFPWKVPWNYLPRLAAVG